MSMTHLEREVLIHRYLYYVEAVPILSDHTYDDLERAARAALPEDNVVHQVGSSLVSSYPEDIRIEARERAGLD